MSGRDEITEPLPPENSDNALRLLNEVREIQRGRKHATGLAETEIETEGLLDAVTHTEELDPSWWMHGLVDQNSLPQAIGRFQIIRQLGFGGFARVFLAHDSKIDRDVALKVPNLTAMASAEARERFEREAHAAGILSHPNIVAVYENGNVGPISFIAYEYCDGPTLSQWFTNQDRRISTVESARIVARLAEAVEHAHQRGVIHRDLKPANVLIEVGEGSEASRVRITDFGLAKSVESDEPAVTADGAIVGTPAYMSPEQALGSKQIGKLSDVFSLGVMLFELLTGTLPFKKENNLSTLRAIEYDDPQFPRGTKQSVPVDLEAICLKCLEKSPEHRYSSAFELAEDLNSWLDGRCVTARRPTSAERFTRWCHRNPIVAATTTFAFCSLLVGLAGTTWQWRNAVTHAEIARQATVDAIEARDNADAARKDAFAARDESEESKQQAIVAKEEAISANLDSSLFSDFMVNGVMSAARPVGVRGGRGKDITVREMLTEMENEIESLSQRPAVEARARNAFGSAWRSLGNYDKATEHFLRVLELKEQLGELDEQTFSSTLGLANVLFRKGELEPARRLLEASYPKAKQILGEDNMLAIGYLNTLAGILLRQEEYPLAIERFERLRTIFVEKHGLDHAATQTFTLNLAVAYREGGDDDTAIEILQQQLERQIESLGKNNYLTLRTMTELGETLSLGGRASEGKIYIDEALEVSKSLMGEKHPKTIEAMLYKARSLQKLGDSSAAIEFCKRTQKLCESNYKEDHPLALQCILLLSQLYDTEEDYASHAASISKLIAIHRNNGNEEQELRHIPSLAKALYELGEFKQLETLVYENRPKMIEQIGIADVTTVSLSYFWARALAASGKWQLAADEFKALTESFRATMMHTKYSYALLAKFLAGHANCLNELHEFEQAEILVAESLMLRRKYEATPWQVNEAEGILADCRIGQGEVENSQSQLENSHSFIEKQYQTQPSAAHRRLLMYSFNRMVRLYEKLGQDEKNQSIKQQLNELVP